MTIAGKINLNYDPVNAQQAGFSASKAPGVLFSGAFGAGKTLALCQKALRLSTDYPGNFGLIARKTRASLTHTTLKTWQDDVCPQELIADYNKTEGLFTLTNGSQIIFGGLDDPLKLGSLNLGFAAIDEALETTQEDWEMLEGRLRKPGMPHQIFGATNPGFPAHYLYRFFFGDERPGYEVYQSSTRDNTTLDADFLVRLERFTGVYYKRNVLGLWVGSEGLVYSSFDSASDTHPRFEIPMDWHIYVGHDFGSANPAAIFYARDPKVGNEFWVWHEYKPGAGRSIYDHVQEFKKITEGRTVVSRKGGSHQEDEIRQGYAAQGWPISEPQWSNDVKRGIQNVIDLHSISRIKVFSDMREYLNEKLSYAYKKGEDVPDGTIERKSHYHLMDAERYILSGYPPEGTADSQVTEIHKFK